MKGTVIHNRLRNQRSFYLDKLQKHGTHSAHSVGWYEGVQDRLFRSMMKLFRKKKRDDAFTILDIGCGLGDFSSFAKYCGFRKIKYCGIDIVKEMIYAAKNKYPEMNFMVADFMDTGFKKRFDYLLCSGALNINNYNSENKHLNYVKKFIKKMYRCSIHGCTFNLLSIEGKKYFPDDPHFFYADPEEIVTFCSSFCPEIDFEDSFSNFCFTIYLHKADDTM